MARAAGSVRMSTGRVCKSRLRGVLAFVILWVPVVSHNSVTLCSGLSVAPAWVPAPRVCP